jgi:hypothetical protein
MNMGAGVAALSICLGIALINDLPRPVQAVETKYCIIDYKARVKRFHMQPNGKLVEKHTNEWVKGYGPCNLMDRYEYT